MSARTYSNVENGTRDQRLSDEQLRTIADLCSVPRDFMSRGFDPATTDQPSVLERTEALEQQMETVLQLIARRAIVQAGSATSREAHLGSPEEARGGGQTG